MKDRTHDISLIDYHVKDVESLGKVLNDAAAAAFPRSGSSRYRDVYVLLLSWEDDDLGVVGEIDDLEAVFRDIYRYRVERWKIPSTTSHNSLVDRIMHALRDFESNDKLFITYYGGHGFMNDDRQCVWLSIQTMLEQAECDVLVLLDCCAAASSGGSHGKGVTELIAACGFEAFAPGVGEHSFTRSLIEELKYLSQRCEAITTALLHNKVLARIKESCQTSLSEVWPDEKFDSPKVLISVALQEDQRLNAENWLNWLKSVPALAKFVHVEVSNDPAISFLAFVRSHNFLGSCAKYDAYNDGIESVRRDAKAGLSDIGRSGVAGSGMMFSNKRWDPWVSLVDHNHPAYSADLRIIEPNPHGDAPLPIIDLPGPESRDPSSPMTRGISHTSDSFSTSIDSVTEASTKVTSCASNTSGTFKAGPNPISNNSGQDVQTIEFACLYDICTYRLTNRKDHDRHINLRHRDLAGRLVCPLAKKYEKASACKRVAENGFTSRDLDEHLREVHKVNLPQTTGKNVGEDLEIPGVVSTKPGAAHRIPTDPGEKFPKDRGLEADFTNFLNDYEDDVLVDERGIPFKDPDQKAMPPRVHWTEVEANLGLKAGEETVDETDIILPPPSG
ncbi:MAG: hypothetical protein Q9226_007162 [Calogaya cf. arnoldii]